jgi:NADH-quinone oxidoreductase subunit L
MKALYLGIVLFPLIGSIIAGVFGQRIGRVAAHRVTITGVGASFFLSLIAFIDIVLNDGPAFNGPVYTWLSSGGLEFHVGFLIDKLSVIMMVVVTFVSWMIHIYTIGYMHDDPGYQRFFSYISLFTFSMLMLVMSNNFVQLFFGWEAVGLVSYLLIGFWFKRESAIQANLKAFLVNRVGDLGFLLGIGMVLMYFNTLDFAEVFRQAPGLANKEVQLFFDVNWGLMTVICILLFIGAMGKSAQVPLHVWLPDSMEGPTPISALIHAATMVTAGIFMVARMSPLFELSETALCFVMFIGCITALFMGFLGVVQNDIKRVIAYSTLSQLGYMTVALGASAYAAGIFHLVTHAFFKALLFLGAGSVIIALHHEQDMRKMGGLYKYMPITWITMLIGTLALIGFPGMAGFFSKDAIIEAVYYSNLPGSWLAYVAVLLGVFVTSFYSFRLLFMVFHGKERMDHHTKEHLHESPKVVTVPLMVLAVPSVIIGAVGIGPMLFHGYFAEAIFVVPQHDVLKGMAEEFHGWLAMAEHGFSTLPFLLALSGAAFAFYCYILHPEFPDRVVERYQRINNLLQRKYGFDDFNQTVFAGGARETGWWLWRLGDVYLIDDMVVNGSARNVGRFSGVVRLLQSGYLYHYAFAMIIGLLLFIIYFVYGLGR